MNILIVSQYFWPENFRINDLALELKSRGNVVTVLTGIPNYPSGSFYPGYGFFSPFRQTYKGVKVIRSPLFPRGTNRKWMLVLNYISFALWASVVGALFCRKKYDAIFVFEVSPITVGIPAIVIKYFTKAPIFFWVQDLWPESLTGTKSVKSSRIISWVEKLVRFIYRHCDKILVTSQCFVEKIVSQGEKREKITFYPQWAESVFKEVDADPGSPEGKEMPDGFRVMFAGSLGVAQSFETILEAAEILRNYQDIKWVIIGDGRVKEWIEQEISKRDLKKNIFLLGSKPLERMPAYFSHAHALLVSLRNNPIYSMTIPGKVQAYLACGKPILASLDGEGRELVEKSGSGFASSAGDAQGLSEIVLKMYDLEPKERSQMGKSGKCFSHRNFDRNRLIDTLEQMFHDSIS